MNTSKMIPVPTSVCFKLVYGVGDSGHYVIGFQIHLSYFSLLPTIQFSPQPYFTAPSLDLTKWAVCQCMNYIKHHRSHNQAAYYSILTREGKIIPDLLSPHLLHLNCLVDLPWSMRVYWLVLGFFRNNTVFWSDTLLPLKLTYHQYQIINRPRR